MSRHRSVDYAMIRSLAAMVPRPPWDEIARRGGDCSVSYAKLVASGRVGGTANTQSRLVIPPLGSKAPRGLPAIDNPAISDGRTLFPSTVSDALSYPHAVLKSGFSSAKIGKLITKGKWKGFPIYTLTLEERATCPKECRHWRSCFGNQMQHAHRLTAGSSLEERLIDEVCALGERHPKGFAVRLHVLGDFYSVEYVDLWRRLLELVPAAHAFGFSARWNSADPIAVALVQLAIERWDRFAIRFSNAPVDECSTVSIEHPYQRPADAIICPQQQGKTQACATCGLCWNSKRRVAFLQH